MKHLDVKLDITHISEEDQLKMKNRKIDFGKWPVCSVCGQPIGSKSEWDRTPALHLNCKNSKIIPLKKYIETVLGKEFDNNKWSFGTMPDLVADDWLKEHMNDELTCGVQ